VCVSAASLAARRSVTTPIFLVREAVQEACMPFMSYNIHVLSCLQLSPPGYACALVEPGWSLLAANGWHEEWKFYCWAAMCGVPFCNAEGRSIVSAYDPPALQLRIPSCIAYGAGAASVALGEQVWFGVGGHAAAFLGWYPDFAAPEGAHCRLIVCRPATWCCSVTIPTALHVLCCTGLSAFPVSVV
jgi:hypothetical protein